MRIQTTGYQRDKLFSDLALGIVNGLDSAIWAYVFATILFGGVLSVFLPVGLTVIICSWAVASLIMIALSRVDVHLVCTDEQAIIILGAIGALMAVYMGPDATSAKGLSTLLAVIVLTSLLAALSFYLIARLNLTHVLGMVPYPVVCGYMVGFVWLYLDAGINLATDVSVSSELFTVLTQANNTMKLVISIAGGLALYVLSNRVESPWVLPIMSTFFVAAFYGVATLSGMSHEGLVADGWLFEIDTKVAGIGDFIAMISPWLIDTRFIMSVLPEIATIIFICTLTASMDVSILSALNYRLNVRTGDEMMNNSAGILSCALLCAPPAITDATDSEIYRRFGATSRWMQIASCAVLLAVVPVGTTLIAYVPTVLTGAVVFMMAFQIFDDWMCRSMAELGTEDRAIILLILGTVIAFGFVEGVLVGILVTALLFVLRYSFISAVHGEYELSEIRSSVERSNADIAVLSRYSEQALIIPLRGFLFFGTSNTIREFLFDKINTGQHSTFLLDLRRVTGVDGSAIQVFRQIKQICDSTGIQLLYSNVPDATRDRLIELDAVDQHDGEALIFADLDLAVEWLEDEFLTRHPERSQANSIRSFLEDGVGDAAKADLLLSVMEETKLGTGDMLFRQGDPDDGIYMLESGAVSAFVDDGDGGLIRIKKFIPGALIGELSGYTEARSRTASITADESSVLYHLDMSRVPVDSHERSEAMSAVHEMVARTLSRRLASMNRRLINEIS